MQGGVEMPPQYLYGLGLTRAHKVISPQKLLVCCFLALSPLLFSLERCLASPRSCFSIYIHVLHVLVGNIRFGTE